MLLELDSWCTIFEILRETCIEDVRILKGIGIQVGNPTTYGEITPKFVEQIIHEIGITADDIFYDIGSGIGNVVLQVATQIGCVSHGIEIRPELTDIACRMQNKLIELSKTRYKNSLKVPEIHFHTGDALSEEYDLQDATIIFLNNWCFGGELEHDLFVKFQKLLKEGTKIICLKDAFPRFRPNSLRYDDLPCQRFRYPWRKFLSCEDAISWDSRLVECVIYQIHDYGCSVAQANSLINSLQIFDDPIPALPSARPRQLNVEEAKIMLKRLLSENFVAKDIPLTGRSENDILLLIKEMQNQTFCSSFADSTIIYNQLLGTAKLPKKFPTPQIVEIRETARDKVFPTVHSGWVTCPDDFEKAFERQKIPTKKLRTSNVFLRRNMRNFEEEEIPTKPKFLFIQRRPFSRVVEEEDELFIVFPSFIKDPKQKITASARIPPHLRIGTRPSWKPARPKKKPPLILPPPIPPKISFGILKPGLRPNWANIRAKRNTIIVNRPNPFQNYPSNRYSSRLHHSFATLSLRANSSLPFIPTTNTLQLNRDKLKTLNPSITYYQPQFPTKHNSPHSNGKSNSQQKSKKRSKSHMASQEHEAQQPRKKVPAHFHSTSDLHHSSHPGTPSHVRVPSPPPNILRPCAIVPHIHPPLIPPISAPTPIPPRPIASPKKKPIPGSARNPKLVRKNHAGSASYMEDNKANRRSTRIRKKEFKKTLFIPIAPQLQDSKRSIAIEPSPPKLRERAVPGESKRSEPLKRAKLGVKNPPVFLRRNIPKNGKIKKPHRRNSQPITHKETTEATRPRNIMSIDFISNAPVSNTEPSTISTSYIDITTDDVIIHECAPIRLLPKTVIPSNIFPTETPTLVSSVVISTPEEPTPEESIPEAPIPEQPLPEEPIPEELIPETTAKAKSKAKPKAKSRQTAKVKAAPEAGLVPMSIEKSKSKPKAKKSPPRTTKKKQKKTGHKNGAVKKANVPANGKDSAVVSAANVVLQVSDSPMITAGEAEKSVLQEVDVMHLKEKLLQGEKNIRGMKPSTRQSVRLSRSKRKWRLNL